MQMHVVFMAFAAGAGFGAIFIVGSRFIAYWREHDLGFKSGVIDVMTSLHRLLLILAPLPVTKYAGSYLGDGDAADTWVTMAIMFISFAFILLLNKGLKV